MGQRGPKPTPTALKAVTGARIRVAADLGEGINPPVKAPPMPKDLQGPARAEWKRITPLLIELGLLTELDRAALTNYCTAWGERCRLQAQINADMRAAAEAGKLETDALWRTLPSGIARPSVLVKLRDDAEARCDRYLAHFGLSPATRARVTASRELSSQPQLPGMEDPVAKRLQTLALVK
jgi:P27 family predicted phage terminase small subunit